MAGFFDDKEEVMTIELTEWGKYLYSIGKFKPKYYAFSDDGILYDGTYGGLSSEEQKDIEDRIMNNTPYLKPHVRLVEAKGYYQEYDSATEPDSQVYADPIDSTTLIDTRIENKIKLILQKNSRYSQATRELRHLISNKLGTVRTISQDYPSFDLTMLRSKISSTTNSMSSSYGFIKIPQIEVNLENLLTIVPSGSTFVSKLDEKVNLVNSGVNLVNTNESVVFQDGSKIYFENNFLAIDLFQNGVEYKTKNFNVEVFEYLQESGSYNLKKLKIPLVDDLVDENGFLRDRDPLNEVPFASNLMDLQGETTELSENGNLLSTYFDLQLDRQIPDEMICSLAAEAINRGDNLRLDYDLECPNLSLSYAENARIRNLPAPGVLTKEINCEDGGPICREEI
jgi:hypothetical protein